MEVSMNDIMANSGWYTSADLKKMQRLRERDFPIVVVHEKMIITIGSKALLRSHLPVFGGVSDADAKKKKPKRKREEELLD